MRAGPFPASPGAARPSRFFRVRACQVVRREGADNQESPVHAPGIEIKDFPGFQEGGHPIIRNLGDIDSQGTFLLAGKM